MVLAYFSFPLFATSLVWLALALMAFWIWSASKAKATLFTMLGAVLLGVGSLIPALGSWSETPFWFTLFGAVLATMGYYYTVKPMVDKHIHDLKAKAIAKASSGSGTPGSGTPPPAS